MAEKTTPKKQRAPRQIKDAGQRVVLAALEFDSHDIAARLAQAQGIDLKAMNKADAEKAIKPFLDSLNVLDGGGTLLWANVGQVKADTREEAVDSVIGPDVPGSFRAPNASAWRRQINRKAPTQVPLDVEVVD